MTLEKAISYVIEQEGIGILSEARLRNYLNDLHAFDSPAVRRIVSTMVDDGYMSKLIASSSDDNFDLQFNDVSNRLIQVEGFQADKVNYVMDCLLFAFHKTSKIPVTPRKVVEIKNEHSRKSESVPDKRELKAIQVNGIYLIDYNGQTYDLNESQYKAILRKKDIPADRLEVWLKTYAEENK